MSQSDGSPGSPLSRPLRVMLLLVALTSILSVVYGVLYFVGTPLQVRVTSEFNDLALSLDGRLLAAAAQDGTVRLWDVQQDWAMRTLSGHKGPVISVAFGPTGSTLVSAGREGVVRLWDLSAGQVVREVIVGGGRLYGASLSADGRLLATVSEDEVVRVWEVAAGRAIRELPSDGKPRFAVAISPDGQQVAAADGQSIQVWAVDSGRLTRSLVGYWRDEKAKDAWLGHRKDVTALAFSPDGKRLASGAADATMSIWDLETGRVSGMAEGHWAAVTKLAFSADGNTILSGCRDTNVRAWNSMGKYMGTYTGHLGAVDAVAFGPQPDRVLTAGADGTVRLWETASNTVLRITWSRPGLLPLWGFILGVWMLFSGIVGLVCLRGMWKGQGWSHLSLLALYLLGPVIVLLPPILEVPSYPLSWGVRLQVGWPLLLLAAGYTGLLVLLTRRAVADCYQAPRGRSLSEQLMASRRTLGIRFGIYTAAVWFGILVILFSVLRRFQLDISFMGHYVPFIMRGAGTTLYISAASIALAVVLALIGALGRLSRNPIANGASGFYVSLIRGTPLLVQIFIWYLGLPRLNIVLRAEVAGILALGVNYGAYMTEIFRAGIQAIGKGQHEAAHALGMSGAQTLRRIVLPQAFRIVIPPIGNEFIAMMKDSALVSVMAIWELTYRAQKIGRQYFRALETFLIAAAFYWVLTVIFQFLQGKLETYMARGERK